MGFERLRREKRVLTVCSANMLRSPTIAWVLSNPPYNFDTRSCGTDEYYATIPITPRLLEWADEIVCADTEHFKKVKKLLEDLKLNTPTPVYNLSIPDKFLYRDRSLVKLIKTRYNLLRSLERSSDTWTE